MIFKEWTVSRIYKNGKQQTHYQQRNGHAACQGIEREFLDGTKRYFCCLSPVIML